MASDKWISQTQSRQAEAVGNVPHSSCLSFARRGLQDVGPDRRFATDFMHCDAYTTGSLSQSEPDLLKDWVRLPRKINQIVRGGKKQLDRRSLDSDSSKCMVFRIPLELSMFS